MMLGAFDSLRVVGERLVVISFGFVTIAVAIACWVYIFLSSRLQKRGLQ